jgi:glycosyltransferase involved in cell wall biosynthesis
MSTPLVSCVTPTYGRSALLQEMLWCWSRQDYPNLELVILNDQRNFILECDLPGVRIYNQDERFPSLAAKRNHLNTLISPEAEYVCPLDDDDLFFNDHISRLVAGMEANPTVDRVKNKISYVAVNNLFHSTNAKDGFYAASCFRASRYREMQMSTGYVMGEDSEMLSRYGVSVHELDTPDSTFIYRLGMDIVHASGHWLGNLTDMTEQFAIHCKIGDSVRQYADPTTLELVPELSLNAARLYSSVGFERKIAVDSNSLKL